LLETFSKSPFKNVVTLIRMPESGTKLGPFKEMSVSVSMEAAHGNKSEKQFDDIIHVFVFWPNYDYNKSVTRGRCIVMILNAFI